MKTIIEIRAGEGKVLHRVVEFKKVTDPDGINYFIKKLPGWGYYKKLKPTGFFIPLSHTFNQ